MMLQLFKTCRQLSSVKRYSIAHLNRPENVLEHTGFVAMFCLVIGKDIESINMEKLLSKAICHDMEESIIGDIVTPVKHANTDIHREIVKVGTNAMKTISTLLKRPWLLPLWESVKDGEVECRLIKIADVASVLSKIYEEVTLYGNTSIAAYALNTMRFFEEQLEIEQDPKLIEVLDDLKHINFNLIVGN